ncbi:MAG: cation transporting ATPase C-terminal domain-containing protein [Parcubacteria group bacterium]|nr:cation transporting ATPase C-terminal domain-containing protein [Parcubacteria group bacterium]
MSNSLDEVVLIGMSLVAGLPLPLTALQIIWVNFFTGSLPALSFAFENHIDTKSASTKEDRVILNSEVRFLTLGIGVFSSVLLFALYWTLLYFNIEEHVAKTFLFACFASYILFIAFSFRSLKQPIFSYNIFSNVFLTWSVGIGIVLIAGTIYIPPLQNIFNTVALPPLWLLLLVGWIAVNIILVEAAKWIYRKT